MFEFIKIPGHTSGSMAIRITLDEKTVTFTGDTLQSDGNYLSDIHFGWQGDPSFNREALVDSIMKLTKYESDMILPGHGKYACEMEQPCFAMRRKQHSLRLGNVKQK